MAKEFESTLKDDAEATKEVARRATARAQATAEAVSDEAKRTVGAVKDQFAATAEQAKRQAGEVASAVTERARAIAEDQKSASADQLSGLARAIDQAANELQEQLPQAAEFVRATAAKVDIISNRVRERSVEELAQDVNAFARANTMAFFGISLAAGFALSRFLKSKAPSPSQLEVSGRVSAQSIGPYPVGAPATQSPEASFPSAQT